MEEISKETLEELREKYLKVRKLLDEPHDESNPAEGPDTITKNKAVVILNEMKTKLENLINNSPSSPARIHSSLAIVYLNIGLICIDNEELKDAEESLMRCTEVLKNLELSPEGILPFLSTMNQLAIIWFQWSEFEKSKTFVERAELFYKKYKELESPKQPIGMSEIFGIENPEEPAPNHVLEKLHTLTLYYLAQIYGIAKDHQQSALYCHMTLQRQLELTDLDYIDWALNAATLSQFFMERKHFSQALHHLAAASHILQLHEEILKSNDEKANDNDEVKAAKWEQFRHRSADVARCWAKYGILLMSMSRDRLIALADNVDNEKTIDVSNTDDQNVPVALDEEVLKTMKFEKLAGDIEPIEEQITNKFLLDFNDARKAFLNVQKWLDEAKKYYALETHASDYVHIVQDVSQSYKYLSFFEDDDDRQAKMHKRRVDVLEDVIKELNPRYYQAECRQIWIELGETSSAILDIKLDKLRACDERPSPHALNKINHLAKSAISYYQQFLDSLKESETSPPVNKQFPSELVKPALFAYFHIGTLYNKIITPDKLGQLDNLKASIGAYKFLVDYCQRHEDTAEFMRAELNVCKDLVNLLPLKINKLTQSLHAP